MHTDSCCIYDNPPVKPVSMLSIIRYINTQSTESRRAQQGPDTVGHEGKFPQSGPSYSPTQIPLFCHFCFLPARSPATYTHSTLKLGQDQQHQSRREGRQQQLTGAQPSGSAFTSETTTHSPSSVFTDSMSVSPSTC